ncbi:hypothetical protein VDGE_30448 [Verticillium dahliae]|uniref:Uncharacterized protein n=1 Tax=Verticillium dahliae TaxID=27337 RepID=A0A444RUF4_VERDA|nr:hypothetical protein VDGE_30448 [Verticillium dahliae]
MNPSMVPRTSQYGTLTWQVPAGKTGAMIIDSASTRLPRPFAWYCWRYFPISQKSSTQTDREIVHVPDMDSGSYSILAIFHRST